MSALETRIAALPIWQGRPRIEPLVGGLSNASFSVIDGTGRYVARAGTDYPFHHVSRDRELMTARAAHEAGFAPEVVYAETGLMVSRFIEGRVFGEADVRANIERIAALVGRFHREMPAFVTGAGFMFWVFHVIRDYAHTLAGSRNPLTGRLPELLAVAADLEAAQVPLPIVFGHNDLLPANLIDDGRRLWLIDFEYAGFNTAMFDLAGLASNAGFDAVQSLALLDAYFGPSSRAYRRSHAAMQCASLLREALWALVSEMYLSAPGADYDAYARQNFDRFDAALAVFRRKTTEA
ncbi:MAG: phosphotransferase [Devosia sp.]|nr:phosphotransferase [Devosia sp.]